jgi:5-methylcytosine-specific restriction endonuclease McrA
MLGEPTTCYLCGGALTWTTAEVDHVVPAGRGGTHDPTNLRWTHRVCNRMKSTLTVEEFIATAQRVVAYAARPQE